MLSENTNSITWVAIVTGLVLVVGGGALTLYPDAFNGVSKIVQNKAIPNATALKDGTDGSNLSDILSDGAITVKSKVYAGSAIAVGTGVGDFRSIANSEYTKSQQLSLSRAVSTDGLTADTAYVENPSDDGIVWVFDGGSPLTNAAFNSSAGGDVLDTSKINDNDYYNVGVLVSYNDASGKQSDGTYILYQRIVNVKATGAQLKAWSAESIKANGGSDYSGITNAIGNQTFISEQNRDMFKNLVSNLSLDSDPTKWSDSYKASVVNQMASGLGDYSTTDLLGKVLPVIMVSN